MSVNLIGGTEENMNINTEDSNWILYECEPEIRLIALSLHQTAHLEKRTLTYGGAISFLPTSYWELCISNSTSDTQKISGDISVLQIIGFYYDSILYIFLFWIAVVLKWL